MSYPYVFNDTADGVVGNSYAEVQHVQMWFATYRVGADETISINQVRTMLISISAEIDAMILTKGGQVPPPAGSTILPILQQNAAVGTAAWIAHMRYEMGDEQFGPHAKSLMTVYDANMGMLERGDIEMSHVGVVTAGWLPTARRSLYYQSGNLDQDRSGLPKAPFFTLQDKY